MIFFSPLQDQLASGPRSPQMASSNPFISNGTCYVGPGVEAADAFFPCGNDALGHKTCCGAGDMCLSSRACFNQQHGLTYLLGCSDPLYSDPSCPDKGAWAGEYLFLLLRLLLSALDRAVSMATWRAGVR